MSTSTQPARPSLENFTAIFNAASSEYKNVTGKCLDTHPVAAQLGTCNDPEAVATVLRTQAQDFGKFCNVGENWMKWLDQTIHILLIFSETLEKGIELVSRSPCIHYYCSLTQDSQSFSPAIKAFTGIGILFTVCLCRSPFVAHPRDM